MAIVRDDDRTGLWSRQGKDLTATFPELARAAAEQLPEGCIVDGEAVMWTADRLDFDALQQRLGRGPKAAAAHARSHPASFAAFDVLAVGDQDARGAPLQQRRALLEELASEWASPLHLSPITSDVQQAREWLDTLPATGVEGLVVKSAAQPYAGGSRKWLKVKHRDTMDVIAGAVIGPRSRPEAVVVGLPVGGELRIVGRSTPLNSAAARTLASIILPPTSEHPWPEVVKPVAMDRFNGGRDLVQLTLIEPIVVEVSADVALSGNSFRHAVRYIRARPELSPADVAGR